MFIIATWKMWKNQIGKQKYIELPLLEIATITTVAYTFLLLF